MKYIYIIGFSLLSTINVLLFTVSCVPKKPVYQIYVGGILTEKVEKGAEAIETTMPAAEKELAQHNIDKNQYYLDEEYIITERLEIKRKIDKFKASFNLSNASRPYWVLQLVFLPSKSKGICITESPNYLIKEFKWWEDTIEIEEGNPAIEQYCILVDGKSRFTEKSRDELATYFNEEGKIKVEHLNLNSDPDFIYSLIQNGFYVYHGCYSSFLLIE